MERRKVVLISIGVVAVICIIPIISYGIAWITAGPAGSLQARQTIKSGQFRIQAYSQFFNLCAAAQTDQTRLQAQKTELQQTPTSDQEDRDRIQTNIAGITSDLADTVNEYNADASEGWTVGQFRSNHLPPRLTTDYLEVPITCA